MSVILAAALVLAGGAAAGDAEGRARAIWAEVDGERIKAVSRESCAERYPADFAMRNDCYDAMIEGAKKWLDAADLAQASPELKPALLECLSRYFEDGRMNWTMAGVCAEVQVEAWRKQR